ncbi:MAG: DegT/DnrJ/EryC1/StrS family aminotransferase [Gammaproteobacteria bacterium]|nr:DegT/DnrJ/EryC1/StrS family aminotransferase [Gammaproteobacteria bacterium]
MSAPDIDETDVEAVAEVLRSGRLALGPRAEEFEHRIAEYAGVQHAVAVSSGTAALHLILRGLGIGPGDEVLVPSFTFAASVNAILYVGASPVFADIEPEQYILDPEDTARRVTGRTRAIMAVDVFGHPVEWDALSASAERHGLELIDDSCEALGAEYRGRRIGGFGAAAAFAFYPNKQMTTGEGGVIVTRDGRLAGLARSLRNQGRAEGSTWLEHLLLGYNYRMDELSAALGISQLKRIEDFLGRRERVAARYSALLRAFDWLDIPVVRPHVRMSWFVYVVRLAEGVDRDRVVLAMEAQGVPARAYFPPMHLQPYVRERLGTGPGMLPVTEALARRTLALPFHNHLSDEEIERVVGCLERAVG